MFGAIRNGMQELIKMRQKEMSKNLFMMAGFEQKQIQKLSHIWSKKENLIHVPRGTKHILSAQVHQ